MLDLMNWNFQGVPFWDDELTYIYALAHLVGTSHMWAFTFKVKENYKFSPSVIPATFKYLIATCGCYQQNVGLWVQRN